MLALSTLAQIIFLPFLLSPIRLDPIGVLRRLQLPFSSSLSPSTSATLGALNSRSAAADCIEFLLSHPSALKPLLAYALLGGLGQLFIFETIEQFGGLTLVMITVTRKLFTMLLSVIVFDHQLALGQWCGIAVVFGGIGLEAAIKWRDMIRKARRD